MQGVSKGCNGLATLPSSLRVALDAVVWAMIQPQWIDNTMVNKPTKELMMDEAQLKTYLAERVREFGEKWNEIENDIRQRHQEEDKTLREKYPGDAYHFQSGTDWFSSFGERIAPLFDEYCTDKHRVYGGKGARSFGFPTKFAGIEDPVLISVELKTGGTTMVVTQTAFEDQYLVVVLKKAGEWRIDSYKARRYGDEKWDNKIL